MRIWTILIVISINFTVYGSKISRLVVYNQRSRSRIEDQTLSITKRDAGSVGDAKKIFGSNMNVEDFDESEFSDYGGGPVKLQEQLDTSFKFSGCWVNADHPSMKPALKWRQLRGLIDPNKLQQNFGTSDGPDEDSLAAFSYQKRKASDTAYFESCSMGCIQGPVKLSMKYWLTQGVILEVCYRQVFFDEGGPLACQQIPADGQPGPTDVTLDIADQYTAIVIKASNFVSAKGSAAVIDDVTVEYNLCDGSVTQSAAATTAQVPTRSPPAAPSRQPVGPPQQRLPVTPTAAVRQPATPTAVRESATSAMGNVVENAQTCRSVQCLFDRDLCAYRNPQTSDSQDFQQVSIINGRFKNQLTGIREGPNGRPYAATYLSKNQAAMLESGPLDLSGDRTLTLELYEATQGINTRLCFGSATNCPYRTRGILQTDGRVWKTITWPVPQSTKKLYILSENDGVNEGAVGYSNVRLIASGSDGQQTVCPGLRYRQLNLRRREFRMTR